MTAPGLVWTSANVGKTAMACRHRCGGADTRLRDAEGKPSHKVCAELALQRATEAATAAYTTNQIGDS